MRWVSGLRGPAAPVLPLWGHALQPDGGATRSRLIRRVPWPAASEVIEDSFARSMVDHTERRRSEALRLRRTRRAILATLLLLANVAGAVNLFGSPAARV